MSKQSREANRAARSIIKLTKREWNPAMLRAWAEPRSADVLAAMAAASDNRYQAILTFIKAGHNADRLRKSLRAAEVKG